MRVRVLTINVQHDVGGRERTAVLNRELRRLRPDIVVAQEVCYPEKWDQLADLVDGCDLPYRAHQADLLDDVPLADEFGGSAMACRWPLRVLEVSEHRPHDDGHDHWWTLVAGIELPGAADLVLISPNTVWQLDREISRERQMVEVDELDRRHRQLLPTLVVGDLNADPDAASIRFLRGAQSLDGRSVRYHDAWEVGGSGAGHTWTVDGGAGPGGPAGPGADASPGGDTGPGGYSGGEIERLIGQPGHRRRIDYVFVGSRHAHPHGDARILHAELVGARPIEGIWVSDHAGVLVDLDLRLTAPPAH
jgi:endonuclease/exonuclease/phosphatase family metal-dependent hydrolase